MYKPHTELHIFVCKKSNLWVWTGLKTSKLTTRFLFSSRTEIQKLVFLNVDQRKKNWRICQKKNIPIRDFLHFKTNFLKVKVIRQKITSTKCHAFQHLKSNKVDECNSDKPIAAFLTFYPKTFARSSCMFPCWC